MIFCKPKRIFSWDYRLAGDGSRALLEFSWKTEEGAMTIDGVRYDIRDSGDHRSHWILQKEQDEVASARAPSSDPPKFTIQSSKGPWVLRARSWSGRIFYVERSGKIVGEIARAHWLSRRARIEISEPSCDFPTRCFLFWLVVVAWRRAVAAESA